ncbi:hypothetical protein PoB_005714800 [Plakobranchus ocellatus]|uniref:Uncharacterized protein n=1 Tax=Plakobranchus ocellatus TaxID=259542 RepID=A0AAV4CHV5_9GAST|nr:hypothetical protein PoB_005714800 [Plakobranchus ocellatus]
MATAEDLVGQLVVTPVNRLKARLEKCATASVDSTEEMRLFEEACQMDDRGDLDTEVRLVETMSIKRQQQFSCLMVISHPCVFRHVAQPDTDRLLISAPI